MLTAGRAKRVQWGERIGIAVVAVTFGFLLIIVMLIVAAAVVFSTYAADQEPARRVTAISSDGRYEVLVVQIDTSSNARESGNDVYLRSRRGSAREIRVFEGSTGAEGEAFVETVSFIGPHTIEIITDDGCRYRTDFDPRTLRPDTALSLGRYPNC